MTRSSWSPPAGEFSGYVFDVHGATMGSKNKENANTRTEVDKKYKRKQKMKQRKIERNLVDMQEHDRT